VTDKALVIAISEYALKPLPGAKNDYAHWTALLTSRIFNFSMTSLLDAAATRQEIVRNFRNLLAGATAGDLLVVYLSCHGTRLSVGPATHDGLVAYSAGPTTAADVIFDYEVYRWIREANLPAGVRLTIINDSCHSDGFATVENAAAARQNAATLSAAADGSVNTISRFLPVSVTADDAVIGLQEKVRRTEERAQIGQERQRTAERLRTAGQDTSGAARIVTAPEPLFLSATQSDAAAYEGDADGVARGFFSWALERVVEGDPNITHKNAMNAVDRIVSGLKLDQHPTLRGPRQRNEFLL
jgi:hypothetical protein